MQYNEESPQPPGNTYKHILTDIWRSCSTEMLWMNDKNTERRATQAPQSDLIINAGWEQFCFELPEPVFAGTGLKLAFSDDP